LDQIKTSTIAVKERSQTDIEYMLNTNARIIYDFTAYGYRETGEGNNIKIHDTWDGTQPIGIRDDSIIFMIKALEIDWTIARVFLNFASVFTYWIPYIQLDEYNSYTKPDIRFNKDIMTSFTYIRILTYDTWVGDEGTDSSNARINPYKRIGLWFHLGLAPYFDLPIPTDSSVINLFIKRQTEKYFIINSLYDLSNLSTSSMIFTIDTEYSNNTWLSENIRWYDRDNLRITQALYLTKLPLLIFKNITERFATPTKRWNDCYKILLKLPNKTTKSYIEMLHNASKKPFSLNYKLHITVKGTMTHANLINPESLTNAQSFVLNPRINSQVKTYQVDGTLEFFGVIEQFFIYKGRDIYMFFLSKTDEQSAKWINFEQFDVSKDMQNSVSSRPLIPPGSSEFLVKTLFAVYDKNILVDIKLML
jgi:hypothetical protein